MANYKEVLRLSGSLTLDEKMQLIEALSRLIRQQINLSQETPSSVLDIDVESEPLIGLCDGTEKTRVSLKKWRGFLPKRVDALEFQNSLRQEWNE
ncbi:hypothetical protein [Coleofasciculus sp. E2-BRE-01]|uniref:hypothetical protein n=1 Tax=Coleofasciculus sp. E2-BRE-01 TaxID=3069524 RepID=UPI0032FDDA73